VLRAAGETETTQGNIQDWLQLDEGDPGFQFLTEEEIAAAIFSSIFVSTACIIKLSFHLFSSSVTACGLVVRVHNYTSRDPGFDSRRYQIF
jgi:hypothetical protein